MDELEKKAQKGLESFSKQGDITSLKGSLDGMIDDMLGEEDDINSSGKKSGKNLKLLYIVLAILGLCLIGYFGFEDGSKQKTPLEPVALYAQYFEVLPDATTAKERGQETSSELVSDANKGMADYNIGNFESAAAILKYQDEVEFMVFGAIAEMKNNNLSSALNLLLKSQKEDTTNQYKDIIDWYLSLIHLKKGDVVLSKKSLAIIANGSHYKKKEAQKILDSLK